ncbi:nucleotidyltransferase domain-containing protein [Cyanobacterium aponinum UTEX 3222]|uniref:DNA polymerase subunit beta n=1 Tax=Cyanobacterium aponinum 0216 TaxID=2676140 RepID=A0A844GW80_9CHRO|nr:nucleotidyltransferase domain-containing protein [Cyanobacterium aponinum]MTF39291.1 DNA polymerase subunit beta [Cyanobacterium aponinum 0216]WRL42871.1 nucleotidyltransferase domain-containing protein [Cyanobacterium aponinum UTEX 3222]
MSLINIDKIPQDKLEKICQKWLVKELALFGSILTNKFNENSDIDVLVTFDDSAMWSLFDIVRLKNELKNLFKQEVDLVEKSALSNPFIRYEIINNPQILYESN